MEAKQKVAADTTPPNPEGASAPFTAGLARTLAALREEEFLIISTKQGHYYLQFAGGGEAEAMRAEAVSNSYLEGIERLSGKACNQMLELERAYRPTRQARGQSQLFPRPRSATTVQRRKAEA